MDFKGIDYIALLVESVRQAENYYARLFSMQVVARDGVENRTTLWEGAAGEVTEGADTHDLRRSLLCSGRFQLLLCRHTAECDIGGRLESIGLKMNPGASHLLAGQAEAMGCRIQAVSPGCLEFDDLFGVHWSIVEDA